MVEIEAGGMMTVKAGATMTIQGALGENKLMVATI